MPFFRLLLVFAVFAVVILASDAASATEGKILVFGDSLTAGFGMPSDKAFPVRLEARLRADGVDTPVTNAGISGDTTAGGLARLDAALVDKPALVILELGANDMLRGVPPATVRANLDAMIQKIQASGAKLLLTGMHAVPNWGEDYQRDFDRLYPELAKAHGVTLYPFFLDGVAMDASLNQADGLHPNERGAAIIADRIAPVVERMLGAGMPGGKS